MKQLVRVSYSWNQNFFLDFQSKRVFSAKLWQTMTISRIRTVVSTNWLREQIGSNWKQATKRLRVLDTSFSRDKEVDSYTDSYLQYVLILGT